MKDDLDLNIQGSIFKIRAQKLHNGKYDYSLVEYVDEFQPVVILCKKHGEFLQKPHYHLILGSGCPKCVCYSKHNILYLLKCYTTGLYKIGITTDDLDKRIASIGGVTEVFHVVCNNPRRWEKELHKKYKDYNVYNETVNNGNTEFFSLTEEQVQEVINYMKEL